MLGHSVGHFIPAHFGLSNLRDETYLVIYATKQPFLIKAPRLSGRFGCASTTIDPATEPLRLKRGPWSEANFGSNVVANANTDRSPTFTAGKLP